MTTFAALGVPDDLCEALDAHHIVDAFDIQTATIPPALAGRDVAGRAPTGSGKTLAFGVPLVANVQQAKPKRPRALVLVPTRELAAQVARDLVWLGAARGTRVQSFYGGVGFEKQIKALRRGVDIAVACPGRLADLINRGLVRLDDVDRVVVDEADRMADMGFLPEVKRLLDATDPKRQTLLFSATLDGAVDVLVRRYQNDPVRHDVVKEEAEQLVTHHHWLVDRSQRVDVTADLIKQTGPTIVFSRTRHGSDRLARQLGKHGVRSAVIHGNRSQNQRTRALADFTSGRAHVLVATDVAARGIHVDDVSCVVHYDLPADPKDYVHRSGRTGRAGAQGHVVALVAEDQQKDARKLARALELDVTPGEPDFTLPVAPPGSQYKAGPAQPASKPSGKRSGSSRKRSGSGSGSNAKSRGNNPRSGGGTQHSNSDKPAKHKSGKPSKKANQNGGPGAKGTGQRRKPRTTGGKPNQGPKSHNGRSRGGAGNGSSGRARGAKQHSGRPN